MTVGDPNGSDMLSVGFSPTRDRIAATMEDNSVRVYVAATGQRVGVMRGHLKKVRRRRGPEATPVLPLERVQLGGALTNTVLVWR